MTDKKKTPYEKHVDAVNEMLSKLPPPPKKVTKKKADKKKPQ